MPDKKSGKTTLLICIFHNHNSEYATTVGKIEVSEDDSEQTDEENKKRVSAWVDEKRREHRCAEYGDKCGADVKVAYESLNSAMLTIGAEEIK